MLNNPIQIFQLIGQLKNNPNPIAIVQQMFGNNPLLQQAINMSKGKNPAELRQTVINLCKTKGIDFSQIQNAIQGMGFNI